jgi:glyoxylase-like metal-dependent hydrolase (beta-lactamase superfamily II)
MKTASGPETSLLGQPARYRRGLEELGAGLWAWLQPNGGLGESNAGLVLGDRESLLIDTLWDLRLTRRMLCAIAPLTASAPIKRLVNTHADGDHCWGNQLFSEVTIISTEAAAVDMMREDPGRLLVLSRLGMGVKTIESRRPLARAIERLPKSAMRRVQRLDLAGVPGVRELAGLGGFIRMLASYDFDGVSVTPPTETFSEALEVEVGGRRLELIEIGPAHSPGDLIVHVPDERVVFAGDLVFVGITPIMWAGPVENWIAGLERIIGLEPRLIVPGHGPTTGLDGARAIRDYWRFVAAAIRDRLANGMDSQAAAWDVVRSGEFSQQPFAAWDAPERIAISSAIIARNDEGQRGRVSEAARIRLLARMGELGAELRRQPGSRR